MLYFGSVTKEIGKVAQMHWRESRLIDKQSKDIQGQKQVVIERDEEERRLADRALFLLTFKDTPKQNLRHVLSALGIHTLEEKKTLLQELFRLIREGTVYIPQGLPQLIEEGFNNPTLINTIDLHLLRPFDQMIFELQEEITRLRRKKEKDCNIYTINER
jgi:hypothetical protein